MIDSDVLGKAFEPEERFENPDGTATRYIDEIGFFERVNKKNNCVDYMIKGTDVSNKLPDKILKKFEESNIKDPFYVDDNKKI